MVTRIWNAIVGWFRDRSERVKLINGFNADARDGYVSGEVPVWLTASVSKGTPEYRHAFSKWFSSGFRIKAFTGRQLTKDEIMYIGNIIISNESLVRRLIVLGWDTLEVCGTTGNYGCKWKLIEYTSKINLIGAFGEQQKIKNNE